MKVLGWVKAALSVVFGFGIGLAVTGIVNLLHPVGESIGWTLAAVLAASVLSALAAFLVSRPRRAAPAASKAAGADAKEAGAGSSTP